MVEALDSNRLERVWQGNRLQNPALGERMVAYRLEFAAELHALQVDAYPWCQPDAFHWHGH